MKRCLITRPEHDDTTHFISKWMKEHMDSANGVEFIDLHRERANRKEVTGRLTKKNPQLVLLNGHGSDTTVAGHKDEPLIVAGENDDLLSEKIIHALSCKSAKILGRKSVKTGALAYIGYDDDFIFFYTPTMISRPTTDNTAHLFLDPATKPVSALLKGQTVSEAYQKSQQAYKDQISRLLSSKATKEETAMLRYLWWDMKNQVALGDLQASF